MIMLAIFFVLSLAIGNQQGYVPVPVLVGYGVMSTVSFIFYGVDKLAAINGSQRTPEMHFHLLSLLGGWPGAAIAQRIFRHKKNKSSFMGVFKLLSLINAGVLIAWLASK